MKDWLKKQIGYNDYCQTNNTYIIKHLASLSWDIKQLPKTDQFYYYYYNDTKSLICISGIFVSAHYRFPNSHHQLMSN